MADTKIDVVALANKIADEYEAERKQKDSEQRKKGLSHAGTIWKEAVALEPRLKNLESAVGYWLFPEKGEWYPELRIDGWLPITVTVERPLLGAPRVVFWVERTQRESSLEYALWLARRISSLAAQYRGTRRQKVNGSQQKDCERRDMPRVTEDGAVVYRAPYTTTTVVVPAEVVSQMADGRPLTEGVLWEIVARAKAAETALVV